MADTNPLDAIKERAKALNLEGDEYDDFIESRMRRAGFKRGPGEWIDVEDDDGSPKDDDDEPMTRGDYRRIQSENRRRSLTPPKKETTENPDTKKGTGGRTKKDPWW